MSFDDWYEKNKEALTSMTFESALHKAWSGARSGWAMREKRIKETKEKLRRLSFIQGKYEEPN